MDVLCTIQAQIGEYQKYINTLVTDAPSVEEANLYAIAVECHGGQYVLEGYVYDCHGEMAYKAKGAKVVNTEDIDVLKEYISSYSYDNDVITEILGEDCREEIY